MRKMEIYGLTMVDTWTLLADATVLLNNMAIHSAEKNDKVWLRSSSHPQIAVHNNDTKFTGGEFQ